MLRRIMPDGFTVLIDATGSPSVIHDAIVALREPAWGTESTVQSRYVIQGSYAGQFCIDYNEAFRRETCILLPRDMTQHDLAEVFRRVQDGLRLESIPTAVMDPRDPARVYECLQDSTTSTHTILLDWSASN
jgi:threonine dehydrogenase-like Zn-dependent dehydrogenase